MLRKKSEPRAGLPDLIKNIPNITITAFTIEEGSPLAGKTLGGFNLRKRHNITILALQRGDATITGMSGETLLLAGDVAIVYGTPSFIALAAPLFRREKS
jgi:CPA2 family monovalent cation:H+ antiporter-2